MYASRIGRLLDVEGELACLALVQNLWGQGVLRGLPRVRGDGGAGFLMGYGWNARWIASSSIVAWSAAASRQHATKPARMPTQTYFVISPFPFRLSRTFSVSGCWDKASPSERDISVGDTHLRVE